MGLKTRCNIASMSSSDAGVRFLASSLAAAVAESCTLPTDVAKVRLQVQTSSSGAALQYTGMVDCLVKTSQIEGLSACWKGLAPALIRQVCYSSLALVLYEPIRHAICGES